MALMGLLLISAGMVLYGAVRLTLSFDTVPDQSVCPSGYIRAPVRHLGS